MSTVAERVARGAEWLDNERPGWWREGPGGIDLGQLHMADGCLCVLGQVYALADEDEGMDGFDYAVDVLGVPAVDYGFNVLTMPGGRYIGLGRASDLYAELGTEWKRLIGERRAAP